MEQPFPLASPRILNARYAQNGWIAEICAQRFSLKRNTDPILVLFVLMRRASER